MHRRVPWNIPRILTTMVLLSTGGCALLGGGDNIQHAHGYVATAPGGWKAMAQSESDRAYRLPSGPIVTLNSTCNRDTHEALELMTRHLLLGERKITTRKSELIRVDGHDGLFSSVQSSLDGKVFYLNLFVLPDRGCIFDFSLVSPRPIPAEDTRQFQIFIKSFKYGKS